MKILYLYGSTALIFMVLDAIGLRFLIKPTFDRHVGHLLADPFRIAPAVIFYLGYIVGILWFVSLPSLRENDPLGALIGGIALGLFAYGTYEFTNYATLRDWSYQQVALDTIWGGALTGLSAWAGVMITRYIGP